MENSYNARCPAVKRLLREAQELHEATEEYYAHPVDDNLFEWHFTVRGPPDTEFDGGVYHGRIIMPAEYPMKPPNIIFFTPNGRFQTIKKICLSISGHHPESWQPSWSIRTALLAIIGFMPTPANGAIGSVDYTAEERALLAKKSVDYVCPNCGRVGDLLKERTGANEEIQKEAKAVSAQMTVTGKDISINEKTKNITTKVEEIEISSSQINHSDKTEEETSEASSTSASRMEEIPQDEVRDPISEPSFHGNVNMSDRSSSSSTIQQSNITSTTTRVMEASSTRTQSTHNSLSLIANNILLSAAVAILVALVLRRLFFVEVDSSEEMEDILL